MTRARPYMLASVFLLAGIAGTLSAPARAQTPRRAAARPDSAAVAVERSIWDHVVAERWDRVNASLEGALTVDDGGIYPWTAARTEALRASGCTITDYAMRDLATRQVSSDVVVVAYRAELPARCGSDTQAWQFRYLSVYRRRETGWRLATTSITPVPPPKESSR